MPESGGVIGRQDLHDLLEAKYRQYNHPGFILTDPIQVPHAYSRKEDIEIAAFLTSLITWGQRGTIINNARRMLSWMGDSPWEYLVNTPEDELMCPPGVVHRTFQSIDYGFVIRFLQDIYLHEGGLEALFLSGYAEGGIRNALIRVRQRLVLQHPLSRTLKHFPDVTRGSAAKRMNLFLMWMVRRDGRGVHFGLWEGISPSHLIIPLDTHVGRVARLLGLLKRRQNDWDAAVELTDRLAEFDPYDPVRFDFSLFGLGIFDKF